MATKQQKIDEQRIERVYQESCAGMTIDIMDIGRVFAVGHKAIRSGASDTVLALELISFVYSIRKN